MKRADVRALAEPRDSRQRLDCGFAVCIYASFCKDWAQTTTLRVNCIIKSNANQKYWWHQKKSLQVQSYYSSV